MNRYIYLLFLMFASLQPQISFSAISENAQNWENYKKEGLENEGLKIFIKILHNFEKKIDLITNKDNLNPQQLENASILKYTCRNTIEQIFYNSDSASGHIDSQQIENLEKNLKILGMKCIAELAQGQAEYECSKLIPNEIDNKTSEKVGEEIRNETFKAAWNEIPGSCLHLVDDEIFKQKLQKKINELQTKS